MPDNFFCHIVASKYEKQLLLRVKKTKKYIRHSITSTVPATILCIKERQKEALI